MPNLVRFEDHESDDVFFKLKVLKGGIGEVKSNINNSSNYIYESQFSTTSLK